MPKKKKTPAKKGKEPTIKMDKKDAVARLLTKQAEEMAVFEIKVGEHIRTVGPSSQIAGIMAPKSGSALERQIIASRDAALPNHRHHQALKKAEKERDELERKHLKQLEELESLY